MLPVLVLCFSRVDELRRTVESILKQPHGPIYVSCDGPLQKYESECAAVREYVTELFRLGTIQNLRISEINQGTLIGVSNGIDWFFTMEEIGIVIEDDLVLEPRLLEAVEKLSACLSDESVMSIGLHNQVPLRNVSNPTGIVRRSKFVISWGWVTTRTEWNNRVLKFHDVNYWILFITMIRVIGLSSGTYHIWFYILQRHREKRNTRRCGWDDLWQINCFLKDKSVAVFNGNLITNIGYGVGATNTFGKTLRAEIVSITEIEFNALDIWRLPQNIDKVPDKYFMRNRKISTIIRETLKLRTRLRLN